MNIKQYQELENILSSWWVSLPEEMQKELNEFYETLNKDISRKDIK